jgi:hypothetical protein
MISKSMTVMMLLYMLSTVGMSLSTKDFAEILYAMPVLTRFLGGYCSGSPDLYTLCDQRSLVQNRLLSMPPRHEMEPDFDVETSSLYGACRLATLIFSFGVT